MIKCKFTVETSKFAGVFKTKNINQSFVSSSRAVAPGTKYSKAKAPSAGLQPIKHLSCPATADQSERLSFYSDPKYYLDTEVCVVFAFELNSGKAYRKYSDLQHFGNHLLAR